MAKIHIKTYGCAFNQAESESMAGLLSYAGHQLVEDEDTAELVVINSCTVKGTAETKLFRDLKKFDSEKKKVVVAGCVPQAERSYAESKLINYSIVGNKNLSKITYAVDETLNNNRVVFLDQPDKYNPRLNLPKIRRNPAVEIIPINEGCLSRCTFCKTKQARGNLVSYDPAKILQHAKNAVSEGVKELWLTSQDTATYGFDMNTSIAELLAQLCAIEGNFMIRVGMGNPTHYLRQLQPLITAFQHPKVYKFLHCPLQSGDGLILQDMCRGYTMEQFWKIIHSFRKEIPLITIATDIIVGYPTETEEQFQHTLEAVEQLQPDVVNFSRYWARPNTPAAALPQLDGGVVKERAKRLNTLFQQIALQRNKQWEGWKGDVVVIEEGKKGTNSMVGRNYAYKPVILKERFPIGEQIEVKIVKGMIYDLRAERIANKIR